MLIQAIVTTIALEVARICGWCYIPKYSYERFVSCIHIVFYQQHLLFGVFSTALSFSHLQWIDFNRI